MKKLLNERDAKVADFVREYNAFRRACIEKKMIPYIALGYYPTRIEGYPTFDLITDEQKKDALEMLKAQEAKELLDKEQKKV